VGGRNPPIGYSQKPRHRTSDVIGPLNGVQCVAGLGVACANKGLWGDSLRTVLWSCVAIFFHLRLFFIPSKKQYAAGLSRISAMELLASGSVRTLKSNTPLDLVAHYNREGFAACGLIDRA
jgi:hypothetical protein